MRCGSSRHRWCFFISTLPSGVEDIGFFTWRWDMRAILEGYRYFENKWSLDITECGRFKGFLLETNGRVGMVARKFPSEFGLTCDRWLEAFYSGLHGLIAKWIGGSRNTSVVNSAILNGRPKTEQAYPVIL